MSGNVPAIRFAGFTEPWEQRKLGEFGIKTGPFGSTLHAEDYVAHGTPIVTTEHFKNGDLPSTGDGIPQVSDEDLARLGQYQLLRHDIVFSRVGSVDLNAEVKDAQVGWLFSGRVLRVRPDGSIDSTFMHYGLSTDQVRNSIIERAVGLTMASINTGILGDTAFVAPIDKAEQVMVGSFFSHLDNLITLHQRKHDQLATLKKSLLEKMFPKPGSDVPELRFAGFTEPWEQRKLGDVATFGGGHTPSMNDESNYADGKILWVTSQDVKVDYLSDTTTKLSEKGASELKLYPPGTLLMVTRSGILRHTLPVSMLRKPSTVNQDIRTIISNEDCSSLWLMQHFKAHSKELLVEYGKTGTTVESVDFAKMKSMSLMLPTPDEQRAIGGFFARLDNLITLHQRKHDQLATLKKSLLEKMFV